MEAESDLEAARIKSLLSPENLDAFYIADFITEAEEELLLQKITTSPLPRWTHLSHRRLQTWPSALIKSNTLLDAPLPPWLISPVITPKFDALGIFANTPHKRPNHVLVNEYAPGQGIMPHEDGGAYYPLVATVSLGGDVVLDLYEKNNDNDHGSNGAGDNNGDRGINGEENSGGGRGRQPKYRILQERRGLLVTRGGVYRDYLHGIAEKDRDEGLSPDSICNWDLLGKPERYSCGWYMREARISLTYRDVLKVAKVGNTIKFLDKNK